MQSARSRQSALVRGIHQCGFLAGQHFFGMFDGEKLHKLFRAYAGPIGEQALKMVGTEMHVLRNFIQRGTLAVMLVQIGNRFFDARKVDVGFSGHLFKFEPKIGCPLRNENPFLAEVNQSTFIMTTYIALLRGINVGGHKKVPMADLKKMMSEMGFEDVKTLLNSGNVVFRAKSTSNSALEKQLEQELALTFGFPVPVLVRKGSDIVELVKSEPFAGIEVTKDTRLYLTFVKSEPVKVPELPWYSEDKSFTILKFADKMVHSVLDLSVSKTVAAMKILEDTFGKDITTRNWNTVVKLRNIADRNN